MRKKLFRSKRRFKVRPMNQLPTNQPTNQGIGLLSHYTEGCSMQEIAFHRKNYRSLHHRRSLPSTVGGSGTNSFGTSSKRRPLQHFRSIF
ncbi:hypothetical protein JTB14_025724 [Gonioctena quinquepunctata]|nr:hypothetical protein JTB14_025724 [Gonioctena quinquepunctata]